MGRSPDFKTLFEAVPGLYLVLKPDYTIVAASDAYLRATMMTRPQILGRDLFEVLPATPDDPNAKGTETLRASLQRVLLTKVPDTMPALKYAVRRPEGAGGGYEERYWSPVNSPVMNPEGRVLFLLHSVEDITEFVRLKDQKTKLTETMRSRTEAMGTELFLRAAQLDDANNRLRAQNDELERLYARTMELNELKSQFFANVSHELRTPLTLILGPLSQLECESLPAEVEAKLQVSIRNARTLLKHVNDLLDIAKLSAGEMEPHYSDVPSVGKLTRLAASQFDGLAAERHIAYKLQINDLLSAQLDVDKFQRILVNLLSNAFKFTPVNGKVRCTLKASGSQQFVLEVADSGPGIPPGKRQLVFERFRQLDAGSARQFGGTGLGLAITKDFVRLHGGKIGIAKAPEGGALFSVSLPLAAPGGSAIETTRKHVSRVEADIMIDQIRSSEEAAETSKVEGDATLPLVLVAEDSPEMQDYICSCLEERYRLVRARNGREALQLAQKFNPDLILSDFMMPQMSGDALVAALQKDQALRTIPVILLTARADDSLRVQLLEQGVQDFLTKPFLAAELVARVNNLVAMHRVRKLLQSDLETKTENIEALAQEVMTRTRNLQTINRVKDEFLAAVSHELRTPMNAILGWTDLLTSNSVEPAEYGQVFETLKRNAKLEVKIIEDLLDISRIITGKLHIKARRVRLSDVIAGAIETMELAANNKAIHVQFSDLVGDAAHEGLVCGDQDRLQQVVANLLGNAIKFSEPGGRVLIILRQNGGQLEIILRDQGVGIDPAFAPYLFERFLQEDGSVTRRHGGLGLGLSIVRHIVELHGGEVQAQSDGKGTGATFTVRIPAMQAPGAAAARPPDLAQTAGAKLANEREDIDPLRQLEGVRVLVVDDEPDARLLVSAILKSHGATVETACSASEALTIWQNGKPSVMVSDVGMPGQDGCDLMRRIRVAESNTKEHLPAAALTAFTAAPDRERVLASGFEAFLAKPVQAKQLVSTVVRLASRRADGHVG